MMQGPCNFSRAPDPHLQSNQIAIALIIIQNWGSVFSRLVNEKQTTSYLGVSQTERLPTTPGVFYLKP